MIYRKPKPKGSQQAKAIADNLRQQQTKASQLGYQKVKRGKKQANCFPLQQPTSPPFTQAR